MAKSNLKDRVSNRVKEKGNRSIEERLGRLERLLNNSDKVLDGFPNVPKANQIVRNAGVWYVRNEDNTSWVEMGAGGSGGGAIEVADIDEARGTEGRLFFVLDVRLLYYRPDLNNLIVVYPVASYSAS